LHLETEVTHCQFVQGIQRCFSPGGSCVALQLQLCWVSSSPCKVGQFSFEYCLQSQEISSGIHHWPCFGRLACCSTPGLSLCSFSLLCSLRVWLLAPPPFSRGRFSIPTHPHLSVGVRLQFNVYAFQFCWGGVFNLPRGCTE
jgi:hypothetical protein